MVCSLYSHASVSRYSIATLSRLCGLVAAEFISAYERIPRICVPRDNECRDYKEFARAQKQQRPDRSRGVVIPSEGSYRVTQSSIPLKNSGMTLDSKTNPLCSPLHWRGEAEGWGVLNYFVISILCTKLFPLYCKREKYTPDANREPSNVAEM